MDEVALQQWFRGDLVKREFTLSRKVVESIDDIKQLWKGVDEYASIFNLFQVFYQTYDTIAFDIDGKTAEESYLKYKYVKKQLGDYITRQYFSGRGFWVFIDLENEIKGKTLYKEICRALVEEYGIKDVVDNAVVGDVRRMGRLPSSLNSKSGRYMIRLKGNETLEEILQKSQVYDSYNGEVRRVKLSINLQQVKSEKEEGSSSGGKILWRGGYPSCIYNAEHILKEIGELKHNSRLHYAAFLLWINKEDELREYIKMANDYNERITNYQIEYLKNIKFKPYKCENVNSEICPFTNRRECLFYPSVNTYIRKFAQDGGNNS